MRILLVDDDQRMASFISKGLSEAGFCVKCAPEGTCGLDLALSESFDAAIIDIMLPKMNGLSVIEELRRKNNNTPVIILSNIQISFR